LKAGKSNSQIAEEIYNHTIKKVHSGGIVLMHDIYDSTAEAFCMLADELVAQGYTLVSVSELLGTEKLMCTTKKYGFKW
jgi:peptidoglycan/xylan/chitin deacetylase (PgdA/CDA1 family)